jgi:8-hydroxy-5-deazaflavin:NADPH oxidoreductase
MKIGVIGTGKMGGGLGQALAAAGHEVMVGSRDPDRAKEAARNIGAVGGGSYQEATKDADLVVLAIPWGAVSETLQGLDLAGKILLDITNPFGPGGLVDVEPSSSEEVQRLAPGAKVVKGWNTVYSRNMTQPDFDGINASVFICGDDQKAKEAVIGLAKDIGFDPVDVGSLASAAALTHLIGVMGELRWGPDTQPKLLRR